MDLDQLVKNSVSRLDAKSNQKASDIENIFDRGERIKSLFPDLTVKVTGSWVWITGNTYPVRDGLKLQGAKWSKNRQAWYIPEKNGGYKYRRGYKGPAYAAMAAKYGEEEITLAN